jgi:NAD(P)-dependent dehydrogenase (short-subunit alcohol dehydrogenase family)
LAKGFAAAGARVIVAGRTASDVELVANEIAADGGRAIAVHFDARRGEDCRMVVERTKEAFGGIDAMVVNHGITFHAAPESFPADEFRAVVETNLTSCFLCAQAAGRTMIEAGRKGSIVLISSNASIATFKGLLAYSASKAALDHLGRQLAAEWGPNGIRVNMIGPGYMKSYMRGVEGAYDDPQHLAQVMPKIPLRRYGDPKELVGPAIFLVSDASSYLTGAYLPVDGGYTLT